MCCAWLVGWSLTFLFSTNTAISLYIRDKCAIFYMHSVPYIYFGWLQTSQITEISTVVTCDSFITVWGAKSTSSMVIEMILALKGLSILLTFAYCWATLGPWWSWYAGGWNCRYVSHTGSMSAFCRPGSSSWSTKHTYLYLCITVGE